jgi:uncharacterized membrane protein
MQLIKTGTFGILHMSLAFGVVYLLTGDPIIGGAVALIEPLVNTVGYHFHEKVWRRIERRRAARLGQALESPMPSAWAG